MAKKKWLGLTLEQLRTEHIRLWLWLAKNDAEDKAKWPGWKRLGIAPWEVPHMCFACVVAGENGDMNTGRNCVNCPIEWELGNCACDHGEYMGWAHAWDKQMRMQQARIIAKLWRKNV